MRTRTRGVARRRSWTARRAALRVGPIVGAVLVLLAFWPGLPAGARLQQPTDPGPATEDAQVVAQGVGTLGDADLAWRVVGRSAPPPVNAATVEAALGFLVADTGALLVAGPGGGERVRLAPGEATFVTGDAPQLRVGLGANAAGYYAIELVDAAAVDDVGDGDALFLGEGFAGPGADHDLDLVRDALAVGDRVELPSGAAPTLVLATSGAIAVETAGGGEPTEIAVGEAAVFPGPIAVTAPEEDAVFVAAVVGPAVPTLTGPGVASPVATTAAGASPVAAPDPTATPEPTEPPPTEAPEETPAGDATPAAGSAAEETAADDAAAEDADGDGLAAEAEAALGTDPTVPDSDGDGLSDGDEANDLGTDPVNTDTDADGTIDGDEVAQGTDPLEAAETAPGGTPGDADADGFPDDQELALGTDSNDSDTDDDGLFDGDELTAATGPLNPDTDGDGVLDGDEAADGTDPNDPASL